jgi:UDP-glucose 4-epimerase
MKILVTGGAGYIGSHTVVELINKGFDPIVVDNLSNSRMEAIAAIKKITGKEFTFINVDLCDLTKTNAIFDAHKISAVIHFAAYKAVGESVEDPLKYYHNNLVSLINLLAIYKERKLDNFLFSSSCSVYGQSKVLPVTENTELPVAQSPYGNTKQIGEEIIRDTIFSEKFNGIALRYFNPAGAHESALIGEFPLQPPTNLVPVITQTAIRKREKTVIHGNDYDTPDGTCIRDYIHVVDIAKAHVIAVERLLEKKNKNHYEVFNLGSGTGNTVLQAINTFEKTTGVKLNYEIGPRRPGDVEKVWADTTLANNELGWKCGLDLSDIMRSAWAWEQKLNSIISIKIL